MRRLYTLGSIPAGGVAIVGSRTPPLEAEAFAYALASRLGRPIVAGLALGIDSAAHRGALAAGRPTVAFVPFGFGRTYPPENAELEREIVQRGGALATPLEPGESATDESFVERDRLQVEYSEAIVLVASERSGGAMHAMWFARELDKPRYAVEPPEPAKEPAQWAGNVRALAEGARPLPLDVEAAVRIIDERLDSR